MNPKKKIKRPAFLYYGGKWLIAPWIITFFPPHNNYLEPCGGAASVLLQKPKSRLETFNDIDGNVCNFFRILRDKPKTLIKKINLTPWARDEFHICRNPVRDPLENARRFYVSSFMNISHAPFDKDSGMRTMSYIEQLHTNTGCNFKKSTLQYLYDIAERFSEVQIENKDISYVVRRYDRYDTLIYVDPPYIKEKRSHKNKYKYEMDEKSHIEISDLLKNAKGMVIISGYNCDLYKKLYEDHGWERRDRKFLGNSGCKRIESIWISPSAQKALNKPGKKRMV